MLVDVEFNEMQMIKENSQAPITILRVTSKEFIFSKRRRS